MLCKCLAKKKGNKRDIGDDNVSVLSSTSNLDLQCSLNAHIFHWNRASVLKLAGEKFFIYIFSFISSLAPSAAITQLRGIIPPKIYSSIYKKSKT